MRTPLNATAPCIKSRLHQEAATPRARDATGQAMAGTGRRSPVIAPPPPTSPRVPARQRPRLESPGTHRELTSGGSCALARNAAPVQAFTVYASKTVTITLRNRKVVG